MDNRFERAKERIMSLISQLKEVGWNFEKGYENSYANIPGNIGEASGASRQVFWDYDHEDFVLKVGLAPTDEKYCEKEVEVYNAAVEAGLEKYFGWTARICEVDGVGIYAMEFLCCDEERVSDDSYNYHYKLFCEDEGLDPDTDESHEAWDNVCENSWSNSYDNNDGIREWLLDGVSCITSGSLDEFLESHNINDLHSANIGYRDDTPVIADYAGWGW